MSYKSFRTITTVVGYLKEGVNTRVEKSSFSAVSALCSLTGWN